MQFARRIVKITVFAGSVFVIFSAVVLCAFEVFYSKRVYSIAKDVELAGGSTGITPVFSILESRWAPRLIGARITSLYLGHYPTFRALLAASPVEYQVVAHPEPLHVSPETVARCAALGTIRHMFLDYSDADDSCVAECAELCPFEVVGLSHTKCGKDSISMLCKCHTIHTLRCDGLKIDDIIVDDLACFPKLANLDVSETEMTIVGVRRLCKIPTLRALRVFGLPITSEEVDTLRREFPHITITVN